MFKSWLVAVSLVVATLSTACGQDVSAEPEAAEVVATAEGALGSGPYCGSYCPRGYAVSYFMCNSNCGSCAYGPNAVYCQYIPPSASITASPQTVSVTPGTLGSTRICWSTNGVGYPVWIRVRVNGQPGQLFTKESDEGSDCETAGWIGAGNVYDFTIHTSDSDSATALATVRVTGVASSTSGGGTEPLTCGEGGSCQDGYDCHCGDVCRRVGTLCP